MLTQSSFRKMKCFLGIIGIAFSLAGSELPVAPPESAGMSATKLARVDGIVEDLVRQKKLAGATVAVARHGKLVYFKTFGKMELESDKPMRKDAVFRIYSMSKALTTAAALILYDEGKLGLDDPVSKYVADFKGIKVWNAASNVAPTHEPTVRDLMRHTAGLTYGIFGDSAVDSLYREANVLDRNEDLRDMCTKLGKLPLQYDPGTKWVYSVGVDVLGRVIEVASGMSFDAFLQKRLFAPLDMKDTGFSVPADKQDRFAAIYRSDGNGTLTPSEKQASSPYFAKPKLLSGGGGMVSTTRDYMRFLQMIAQGGELEGVRVLKADTVALMTHNQLPTEAMPISMSIGKRAGVGFGLGFSVRVQPAEQEASGRVGEYGWGGLASTHYWASPKDDLTIVTMEQTLPFSMMLETALKGPIYDAINN
jgi:CubicO group peptidase (beta-lactamase class C family)